MKTQKRNNTSPASRRNRSAARGQTAGMATKLIVMAAVVAAVIFGVAIFFKVTRIEVQGNTIYSAEEIIQASQIEMGDNLLTLNKQAAAGSIRASLAYVEDVSIARSMPDTVVIQVKESEAAFAVMTDTNAVWLVNGVGKALEKIDGTALEEHPQLLGVRIETPTLGQKVTSPSPSALDAALAVITAMDGSGILEHVASINVEKEYDIIVWYEDRYQIKLGGTDELDYKITYLGVILQSLSAYQAGTIDLTFTQSDEARFYAKE